MVQAFFKPHQFAGRVGEESASLLRWELLELTAGDVLCLALVLAFGLAFMGALVVSSCEE